MRDQTRIRTAAKTGMAAAAVWLVALVVEYRYGLQPPGSGTLYYADQALFFLALVGYLVMLLGMWKAEAAGAGRFGRISLGMFVGGLSALLVAQVVQWLTANADNFLFGIGGLLQLVGGTLTGIAVFRAGRWTGWQRFAPVTQGLYYLLVLFVPIAFSGRSPSELGEAVWQVTWFFTSLALFTMSATRTADQGEVRVRAPAA